MTGVLNCLKIAILTRNSFASSGIERLINSEKIEKIESTALQSTNILTKIDDLSSLTTIGMGAFYYSGIQEIFHLDKLTAIGNYAFSKCSNLQGTFNLSSVSSIGRGSFNDCPSL
ncbi:surface antigen Bsp, putative [Trichomonas vaginalis G3]|uniref:Surface antigen Bsp, putative n=1 Tax=Trichomonas vaginalis (strain ATCC PRA-98 / G3) TaxID=412133 RepID=A2FVJ4_TRIV3|nr:ribonuclease inhibitor domain-containing protein [Trichomonas vaginalis G3]EAX91071.1 surface antigen Bsp, putative [Trichomonas vaginalis G3]KAI5534179.1 ribonuclease inhibitor domain-containing protein [Trichomonas vaginalis G3]|eukprot:XP_001304001.1 surface antigen Bsp [Trichomonas vaginalis G3]